MEPLASVYGDVAKTALPILGGVVVFFTAAAYLIAWGEGRKKK